jgi:hypothetical protein
MMTTSPIASLSMVNLDCPDPRAMAAFYAAVLGPWRVLTDPAGHPFCLSARQPAS